MPVYTVMSEKAQPTLRDAIEAEFPSDHFHWTDNISFVRTRESAKQVARKIGVKVQGEDGTVTGTIGSTIVSALAPSYFGYSKTRFWEWLKTSFETVDQ